MHIFHIITTLNKGGAESHLVELCRGLRDRAVALSVAFLKGDGYWAPALNEMGVHTIDLGARGYADPSAIRRLMRLIDAAEPDILHAHMPPGELYLNFAVRLGAPRPCVISKHVDRHPFYGGPGEARLERFCASPAREVICISQAVNAYFAERWPEKLRRKLTTVRYGLKPMGDTETAGLSADASALRAEWGVSSAEILFGIAARLVEQKSIDTLLRAFARLRAKSEVPIKLAIVGHGPLEAGLRSLAAELGIADRVIWAGFRTDIPVVMRAFDVFTLSSIYEGFGLVLLEAMEASSPIVASGISAIPEIVIDGHTGLLVPPRDPEALGDALAKMLDRGRRAAMGAAGRKRLIDAFSVERMTDETMAVYNRVLRR